MGIAGDVLKLRQLLDRIELDHLRRPPGDAREDLLNETFRAEKEAYRLRSPDLNAFVRIVRAELLIGTGRHSEAIPVLNQAAKALGNFRQDDLQVRILGRLAEAQGHLKNWEVVSSICGRGIELVETYRYKVSVPYLQSAYLRSRINLYSWGVRAAYELQDFKLMLVRAELSKCRTTFRFRHQTTNSSDIDAEFSLVCAQLDNCTDNDRRDALLDRRRALWDLRIIQRSQVNVGELQDQYSLEAVQSLLEEDEAIIYYYWIDEERLLIATINRGEYEIEVPNLTPDERARIKRYSDYILAFEPSSPEEGPAWLKWEEFINFLEEAKSFGWRLLPGHGLSCLSGKRRLLISPHRALHVIPFHALQYDGDWLINRFAVTYIPNLSSLLVPRSTGMRRQILAIGTRDYELPDIKLPRLNETEEEVRQIEDAYRRLSIPVIALKGPEGTEQNLRRIEADEGLNKFSCVHFACHGSNVQSDTPMESCLYLRNSKLEGLEIAELRLCAELVVLSACCSGQRPIAGRGMSELPGDEMFGLQAAFFAAGTWRILSALWPVDDTVGLTISTSFHKRFAATGMLPEMALQETIKSYLAQTRTQEERKIYYWGSFFLAAIGRSRRL